MSIAKPGKGQWHKTTWQGETGFVNQYRGTLDGRLRTEEWGGGNRLDDYYRYTGEVARHFQEPTVDATVGVMHKGATGFTSYPPLSAIEGPDPTPEEWLPPASHRSDVGQISLVKNNSSDSKTVLNAAFGTKDAKLGTMTGVGIAAKDALDEGRLIEPSTNLSKNSAKIVQNLQARGVVPDTAVSSASNGLGFWDEPQERTPGYTDEIVSPERVDAGRRLVRDAVRRPRKAGERQMELPF